MKPENPKQTFRPAVFVVAYRLNPLINQIEYFILHRHKHWKGWEFPKGGIDAGETASQTAKREIYEETGNKALKLKKYNSKGIYRYDKRISDRPGMKGQTFTLFSAEIRANKVKIDRKEHSGFKWLSFDKAVKKLTWSNQKKCLRIVHKKIKNGI